MPRKAFLFAVVSLGAAIAVAAWLVWSRWPQQTPAQGAPAPLPEEVTIRLGRAGDDLTVHHAVLLRNPTPGHEVKGELRLTLASPVDLEASLDGQRVAAEITGAAAGTAHVTVPVALHAEKATLELAYRVPAEHSRLSWQVPWALSRLQVLIPQEAGLSLRAASLDSKPLELAAPTQLTVEPVQAGAVLEVELGVAPERSQASPLTLTQLMDAWDAAARAVAGDRWRDYAMISLRVSRLSGYAVALERVWGNPDARHARLEGTAAKEDGRVLVLAIGGSPERRFTDEELAFLRPYYEIFIALTNPGLSREERAQALQRLMLDGGASVVKERVLAAERRGANRVSIGNVDYLVTLLGSDAGATVRVEARLTGH